MNYGRVTSHDGARALPSLRGVEPDEVTDDSTFHGLVNRLGVG